MSSGTPSYRARQPVLLAEQLIAWKRYRDGWSVSDVAVSIARLPAETRVILHGGAM
ncbi:hypothetical protein [Sphingomonas aquatilis]|uniref:Transposase n=1 Tax=Sphingomonas aquatilis TaxID=93063 RepID=A0AAW3TT44_9SPHN|nr:hypothetical protein [Sphingomonas aquatilis]MBB3876112.1 hypothetical protein [Sphingomonas aquatilis]